MRDPEMTLAGVSQVLPNQLDDAFSERMFGCNILISRFFYSDFEYEYRATLVGAVEPTLPSGLAGFLFSRTSCDGGRCVCLISSTPPTKAALLHFLCLHVEIFAADSLVAISSGSAEA